MDIDTVQARQAFSANYAQARDKFLQAAGQAGASTQAVVHPLRGRDGEELAIDLALIGAADADRLLLVTSGCHGVEGHCGSGVQVHALRDHAWHDRCTRLGVAVLHVHALNPHGFSHGRRWTQENVDLNRNFLDFGAPLPAHAAYQALHPVLLPAQWPPNAEHPDPLDGFVAKAGRAALQAAVTQGQYAFRDGLFYGGDKPCWSNCAVRGILRRHVARARRVAWIDLHTGLGPCGHGERGFAGRDDDAAALARAQAWWGGAGRTPVMRLYDGSSVSSPMTGVLWGAAYDECPDSEKTAMAMEFGTQPLRQVLDALRAEQWLHAHPQAPASLAQDIRRALRDAFYVDTDDWKRQVLAQAREALDQALQGLAG